MTFLPELRADKSFVFHQTVGSPLIRWIHNDSMYVRFWWTEKTCCKSTLLMTALLKGIGLLLILLQKPELINLHKLLNRCQILNKQPNTKPDFQ